MPEVGGRLHEVAVRVLDVEVVVAEAQPRGRVAAGADALQRPRLEDVDRVAPVARAHAADRRQPAGIVLRRVGVRVGQVAPGLARRCRRGRDRSARARPPSTTGASASSAISAMPQARRVRCGQGGGRGTRSRAGRSARSTSTSTTSSTPSSVPGVGAQRERDVVVAEARLAERPDAATRAERGRRDQHGRGAQAQRRRRRTRTRGRRRRRRSRRASRRAGSRSRARRSPGRRARASAA